MNMVMDTVMVHQRALLRTSARISRACYQRLRFVPPLRVMNMQHIHMLTQKRADILTRGPCHQKISMYIPLRIVRLSKIWQLAGVLLNHRRTLHCLAPLIIPITITPNPVKFLAVVATGTITQT